MSIETSKRLCSVYVFKNVTTRRLKIGHSVDVQARKRTLQTGNDEEIVILHSRVFKRCKAVEIALHELFAAHRKRGEWFEISLQNKMLLDKIMTHNGLTEHERASLTRMGLIEV